MRDIAVIIPFDVQARLREFSEQALNGQVVLNFNQGRIESFEYRVHRRVPGKRNGEVEVPSVAKLAPALQKTS